MNVGKYKQIFSNLNYKNIFFPVFAAMLGCFYAFKNIDFPLQIFDRGIVSAATFEMLDINKRVGFFWDALLLGIFIFLIVLIIQNFLLIRFKEISQHISFINLISFFGSIVIIHSLLSTEQIFTLEFINYTIGFIGFSALLSIILKKKYLLEKKHFAASHFWYIITGFSIYFIITNFNLYFSEKTFRINFIFPFEIAFCTMLFVQLISKYKKITLEALLKYSFPLLLLVLWNFVSNELNYIFNQNSIFLNPLIAVIGGYIIILFFYLIKWKIQQNKIAKPASAQLAQYYLPLLLIIIACYAYYIPVIPAISELFETANPANSIMMSCKYGKLPFFDFLNSHALSETFFCYIYVFLNHFNGSLDLFIYNFVHNVIYVLIAYNFLRKLTQNAYLSFAVSLLLPFQEVIFCTFFSYSIISVFILSRIYSKPSYKNYILGFIWSFFLMLWRIDIGYANITAFLLITLLLIFMQYEPKKLIRFCFSLFGVILSFAIITIIIAVIRKTDLFAVIKQAMHYLSGNQAHGSLSIYNEPMRLFMMHYFIFPSIIAFSAIIIVLRLKHFIRKNVFIILSILFLSVFYFCNFPRGIVRHGFNEGSDSFLSSFVYLILSLLLYLIVSKKYASTKNFILILSLYFLIVAFKFPDIKDYSSVFEKFNIAFKDYKPLNNTKVKIKRYNEDSAFAAANYSELKEFLDTHFQKNATFIDFSTTPLLYFYTQRNVPSYFPQYMQNTIDDDLQYQNIADFNKYDIPLVVFSNLSDNWFNAIDGVPNSVRYNKIAQYIFINYQPYDTICQHSIWLRKGDPLLRNKPTNDTLNTSPMFFDLKKLPYMEANYATKTILGDVICQWNEKQIKLNTFRKLELPVEIDKSKGNYLILDFERKDTVAQKCLVILSKDTIQYGSYSFDVLNKTNHEKYVLRLSTQFSWYSKPVNSLIIKFENELSAPVTQSVQLYKAR